MFCYNLVDDPNVARHLQDFSPLSKLTSAVFLKCHPPSANDNKNVFNIPPKKSMN